MDVRPAAITIPTVSAWRSPMRGPGNRAVGPALTHLCAVSAILLLVELALLVDGPDEAPWIAPAYPVIAAVHVGTGVLAWYRRPSNRTGRLLVATGILWFVAGCQFIGVGVLHSVGRAVDVVVIAAVCHLFLAFPSGRLTSAPARIVVVTLYLLTTVVEIPHYLFVPDAGMQLADLPWSASLSTVLQTVLGAIALGATVLIMIGRFVRARPGVRATLGPLYGLGVLVVLLLGTAAGVLGPWFDLDGITVAAVQLTALGIVPLAFTIGLLNGGFIRTAELDELATRLGEPRDLRTGAWLRNTLAHTLGDPTLELAYASDDGTHIDEVGRPLELPAAGPSPPAASVRITLGGRDAGAIVYDPRISPDPRPVEAVGALLAIEIDRQRLVADLRAEHLALLASRARLAEAADTERRRIARDLHDGIQARLVLLQLIAGNGLDDPAAHEPALAEVSAGLGRVVDELRRLVHGVLPAALVERGLSAAIEDLVDTIPLPVRLELPPDDGTLPLVVQSTAYYVVAEGLSNAVKHSRADRLQVRVLRSAGTLDVEVTDNGVGGAFLAGTGIRGVSDRLASVGGMLEIRSSAGRGTTLHGRLPCA
jgi:signal transduction histidine kinase